jgi:hypothetical protein
MRRLVRFAGALLVALSALTFQSVLLPDRAFACSCVADPPTFEETAAQPNVTIVVATVGLGQRNAVPLAVETWFHGDAPSQTIWVRGVPAGGGSMCELPLFAAQRWLLVLRGGPTDPGGDGLYEASFCDQSTQMGTDAGDALFAEAVSLFGLGPGPPSPEPQPQAPIDLKPWIGEGLIWAIVLFGLGLLFFGLIALVARRRRQS